MKRIPRLIALSTLLTLATGVCSSSANAKEIVAVLSSESLPYMEALAGVRETLGAPLKVVNLSKSESLPAQPGIVIAIGGKAASQNYPSDVPLIYCVAPAVFIDKATHSGPLVRVFVSPPPQITIERLKEIQPNLKRLAMLWMNPGAVKHSEAFATEGAKQGIVVISKRVESASDLLSQLRSLKGNADALWLTPDPSLINPENFSSIKEFSLSNDIPLYVAMESLAGEGASAAISVSFREMGRRAGSLAAQALAGSMSNSDAYGDQTKVTVNASVALHSGLIIPAAVLKKVDRVIP